MRRIRWIYLAVAVAGLAIYPFVAATGKDAIYLLSSASVLVALWWGVRTYQPADRSPWLLLMAGFGCFFLGDATSIVLDHTVGAAKPFPSLADVAYLLFYPLVYVAIGRFLSSTGHPDRAAWVDASIWTTGAAVVPGSHCFSRTSSPMGSAPCPPSPGWSTRCSTSACS